MKQNIIMVVLKIEVDIQLKKILLLFLEHLDKEDIMAEEADSMAEVLMEEDQDI